MSTTGEANLYQASGDDACPEIELCLDKMFGRTPAEVQAAKLRRGINVDGVGSNPTYGNVKVGERFNYDMYPQGDIDLDNAKPRSYTVAGHRNQASFGLSRILFFDGANLSKSENTVRKEYQNQLGLRKWWLKNIDSIDAGYCLNTIYIPPKHHFKHVYVCNMCPVEGLAYEVRLKRTGTVLATIDGSQDTSQCIEVPSASKWQHDKGEIIQIHLTAVPPLNTDSCKPGKGNLDGWCVMTAADVFCPNTGSG